MRDRFALLLNAYSVLAARDRTALAMRTGRIRNLLKRFGEIRNLVDASGRARAADDRRRTQALLVGYNETVERYRDQQEQVADDFNLLDVMQLTGKEIRHSMVLAWLLDHDMRKLGTHAQGNLGFRLFLTEFGLPMDYADCKCWVRREVAGYESIVDVEVACRDRFVIHIENKVWSGEGTDQTCREWSDLQRRAAGLKVSAPDVHALFLTPHGTKPANPNFCAIPWGRIVRVLEAFVDQAKPPEVKLFTAHYARALRRFIVIQDICEDGNAEELMNEAERFLLERWGEARLLEESMDAVRTKYKEVFQQIIDAVTAGHPELDANAAYPTQFWDEGLIGFGRKSWPGGESRRPSGLWLWNLRLEVLAAEDSEPPYAPIWVPKRSKSNLDYDAARVALKEAAKDLLSSEELKRTVSAESGEEALLYLPAPSKGELLGSLSAGDGQGFVKLFVSQFDLMARFVPVLDKVFRECLGKDDGA